MRFHWAKVLALLSLLFLFMSAVNMMGCGFGILREASRALMSSVAANPLMALMMGVLATSIVQSSSVTTCIVVGLVGGGQVSVEEAVPLVMGANIGTTITCSLVAMGYVGRRGRFQRAFSTSTMHDFFNFAAVVLLLPLELKTHLLSRGGRWIAGFFSQVTHFSSPRSPLKAATAYLGALVEDLLLRKMEIQPKAAAFVMVGIALVLLFISLYYLTRNLKSILGGRMETVFDQYLFRTPLTAILVGFVFTLALQSSSVTTSLMVPLVTAGVISRYRAFPYMMGAHVGTTVTAFLGALALGSPEGLSIAVVHTLYNVIGVAILFPFRPLRHLPVRLAGRLGVLTLRSRWYALLYIAVVFFAVPILVIVFSS